MDETLVTEDSAPSLVAPTDGGTSGIGQSPDVAVTVPDAGTADIAQQAPDLSASPTADAPPISDLPVAEGIDALRAAVGDAFGFVEMGGPAMWAIAALSVLTVALILWKTMRLLSIGAWSGGRITNRAIEQWRGGNSTEALAMLARRRSHRARLAHAAMVVASDENLGQEAREAETARVARGLLIQAQTGLRGLELASTIGPLLGLLGTVTGMIAAFQALQEAGSRADPSALAGGIWEALLTTAAGMAVAIPAQMALTWFETVVDRMRHDMEDAATRILHGARAMPNTAKRPVAGLRAASTLQQAAE